MINIKSAKRFCEDVSSIENYDEAVADTTTMYAVHHRLETHKYKDRKREEWVERDESIPKSELIALGLYYNRPAKELVFMTQLEHKKLHNRLISGETRIRLSHIRKGKHHTEETKRKIGEAGKGRPAWNKGKVGVSEETRQKLSKAKKGKTLTDEHKRKIAEANKHRHYSEETRRKMSEWQIGRRLSEATKKKISDAMRKRAKEKREVEASLLSTKDASR